VALKEESELPVGECNQRCAWVTCVDFQSINERSRDRDRAVRDVSIKGTAGDIWLTVDRGQHDMDEAATAAFGDPLAVQTLVVVDEMEQTALS